jgi:hypothetical protein
LDLKGNILGDEGVMLLVSALYGNTAIVKLNIALNEIGPLGAGAVAQMLPNTSILSLNISKNFLGDESLKVFANVFAAVEPL